MITENSYWKQLLKNLTNKHIEKKTI